MEIKYLGSDYSLMVNGNKLSDFKENFEKKYFSEFGFITKERELLVEAIRVRSVFINGKNYKKKKIQIIILKLIQI